MPNKKQPVPSKTQLVPSKTPLIFLTRVHEQRAIDITWPTRAPQKRPKGSSFAGSPGPSLGPSYGRGGGRALAGSPLFYWALVSVVSGSRSHAFTGLAGSLPSSTPSLIQSLDFSHLAMNIFPGHHESGNIHPVEKKGTITCTATESAALT